MSDCAVAACQESKPAVMESSLARLASRVRELEGTVDRITTGSEPVAEAGKAVPSSGARTVAQLIEQVPQALDVLDARIAEATNKLASALF